MKKCKFNTQKRKTKQKKRKFHKRKMKEKYRNTFKGAQCQEQKKKSCKKVRQKSSEKQGVKSIQEMIIITLGIRWDCKFEEARKK